MSGPIVTVLASQPLAATLFGAMCLISLRTRDVGGVDIAWGPGLPSSPGSSGVG